MGKLKSCLCAKSVDIDGWGKSLSGMGEMMRKCGLKKDNLTEAAECYNERKRSRYNVPCDFTDDYPAAWMFVVAGDRCSRCDDMIAEDLEDQLDHYCTIEHITEAFGVDGVDLLRRARTLRVLDALEGL